MTQIPEPINCLATIPPELLLVNVAVVFIIDAFDTTNAHMTSSNTIFSLGFSSSPPGSTCLVGGLNSPYMDPTTTAGQYTGSIIADKPGTYQVMVTLESDPNYGGPPTQIQGSPFTIILHDTTPPVVTCPIDVFASTPTVPATVNIGTGTAVDDVDGTFSATSNAPSVGFPLGVTTVVWTATDSSGNIGVSCDQQVSVEGCATLNVNVRSHGNSVSGAPISVVTFDCGNHHPSSSQMLSNCPIVGSGTTGSTGVVSFHVLSGKYICIFQDDFQSVDTRVTPTIQDCNAASVNFAI